LEISSFFDMNQKIYGQFTKRFGSWGGGHGGSGWHHDGARRSWLRKSRWSFGAAVSFAGGAIP
jgi:hypothetical protein